MLAQSKIKSAAEGGAIFPRYSEYVTSAASTLDILPSDLPDEVKTSFATKMDQKAIKELPTEVQVRSSSFTVYCPVWSTLAKC